MLHLAEGAVIGFIAGAWYGAHRSIYVDQIFYRAKFWVEREVLGNAKKHWRW